MRILFLLLISTTLVYSQKDNSLQRILQQYSNHFDTIFSQPKKYQAQVIYTQIDRDAQNKPTFTTYTLGLDENRYFYPASTVKMPAAFLALEKINDLNIINLDKFTPMRNGVGCPPQTEASVDITSKNMLPSVAHYIKKIFMVSDNDAFNRLYEFLGQEDLNKALMDKGFDRTKIVHRLSVSGYGVEDNRYTNPVSFYKNDQLLYHQGLKYSFDRRKWNLKDEIRGKAQMTNDDNIINEPFDFSTKNFVSLKDLHDILSLVIFPEAFEERQRFRLTPEDYIFLYQVMSEMPKESKYPDYSKEPDNYVKFYMHGKDSIPSHIRIFNKVGWAYGFLTDVSYVVDFEKNIEFFLAASIHVNANETYNDGVYEYEKIGLPFFGELGRVILEHEQKRMKKNIPDLSRFKIEQYD